ncbi:MAG: hypothetical protein ABIQ95_00305 [Bdellovibrionia bacterium]
MKRAFTKNLITIFTSLLIYSQGFADGPIGTNVIDENSGDLPYIALTSSEYGFTKYRFEEYSDGLDGLIYFRAQKICEAKGFRSLAAKPKTRTLEHSGKIRAWIPSKYWGLDQRKFRCKKPWIYTNNGKKEIGLPMSIVGRVLTYIPSPLSPIGFVIATTGDYLQFGKEISGTHALERLENGKPVKKRRPFFQGPIKQMFPSISFENKIPHLVYKNVVPHLIFSELRCTNLNDEFFNFDQVPSEWLEWNPKLGFVKKGWPRS